MSLYNSIENKIMTLERKIRRQTPPGRREYAMSYRVHIGNCLRCTCLHIAAR
jgi:hypothetical protein